jgi:hypothetical protein
VPVFWAAAALARSSSLVEEIFQGNAEHNEKQLITVFLKPLPCASGVRISQHDD